MRRDEYLQQVITHYLEAPDTPTKARRNDWAVAATFYQRGILLQDIAHAIRLASLRRYTREPGVPPLEPICSLAYFRRVVETVQREQHEEGYMGYIYWKYRESLEEMVKSAARHQNTAVSKSR